MTRRPSIAGGVETPSAENNSPAVDTPNNTSVTAGAGVTGGAAAGEPHDPIVPADSVAAAAPTPVENNNSITVTLTGALNLQITDTTGQTLNAILADKVDQPNGYVYRAGNQPVALASKLTESLQLTVVEKARQS